MLYVLLARSTIVDRHTGELVAARGEVFTLHSTRWAVLLVERGKAEPSDRTTAEAIELALRLRAIAAPEAAS